MKFDFFTYGGAVFWEDVFFYQKWRIQRNCFTKKYRLLDSWDIRRASGNFETCQKAFIKYIESYEITKQQGKLIVLLHGYGDGKNIFKPLWRKLAFTNSVIAAINYPSLFHSALASAHQLLFFLNHMEDIDEVSFVTKGAGNLVLHHAFNLPYELQKFQERMRIGNIVEINPVIKPKLLCELLSRLKFIRAPFGPMIKDFTEESIKNLPSLPSQFKVLKIFSDSKIYLLYLRFLRKCFIPIEDNTNIDKASVYIQRNSGTALENEEVLNVTVKFLQNGKI